MVSKLAVCPDISNMSCFFMLSRNHGRHLICLLPQGMNECVCGGQSSLECYSQFTVYDVLWGKGEAVSTHQGLMSFTTFPNFLWLVWDHVRELWPIKCWEKWDKPYPGLMLNKRPVYHSSYFLLCHGNCGDMSSKWPTCYVAEGCLTWIELHKQKSSHESSIRSTVTANLI